MESNSQANRILCSERSYMILKDQSPTFFTKCRGKIDVKGKGQVGQDMIIDMDALLD